MGNAPLLQNPLGIYEKALVNGTPDELFAQVAELEFDFMELSVDESPERRERLSWTLKECDAFTRSRFRHGVRVPSMCLSANRAAPLGAADPAIREEGVSIVRHGIELADRLGIRTVQLAGYHHYYDEPHERNGEWYLESLERCLMWAARYNVTIAVETMDTAFMSSVSRILWSIRSLRRSPWLMAYPDVGNLSAWNRNPVEELELGLLEGVVTGVHLKDTLAVTEDHPGQFRDVPFGSGCVDFTAFFRMLTRRNYPGPFLIEMWNRHQEGTREIIAARQWIRERMVEAATPPPLS